ncbi:MAG: nicotinamide mononucleotide transporter family protein [Paludibacteraceae bacterium]
MNKLLFKELFFNLLLSLILFNGLIAILFIIENLWPSISLLNFSSCEFVVGIIASIIGVGYVLTIRNPQNYLGFYMGILMSLLLSLQFYMKGLFDLTILYLFVFIPFQIFSIYSWRKTTNTQIAKPEFLSAKKGVVSIIVFILLIIGDYLFASYFVNHDALWQGISNKCINGIVISASILANFWLIYKKIDAWIYWIIYSVAGIIQGIVVLHNPFNTILFVFFLFINSIAAYSWIKNRENAKK